MDPIVSIIVPVYNAEETLRRCIESVLNQGFTDFELLLVDDGSTDSSAGICREYENGDRRVREYRIPGIWGFQRPGEHSSSFWTATTGSHRTPPALWYGQPGTAGRTW